MTILITVCARGGSKGVPGKNIKLLNGKPLIAYTINSALAFKNYLEPQGHKVDIELSTDDVEIKRVAAANGLASDYVRPVELATDGAGKIEVIRQLFQYAEKVNQVKYDLVLDLDVTSPLRTKDDLLEALEVINADQKAINLFSVNHAHRNPYFNMVERKENGYFALVKDRSDNVLSRQTAPEVFDMNASFYYFKRAFLIGDFKSAITEYSLIYLMDHLCFDIDAPIDYEILEYLMSNDKINFEI